MKKLNVLLLVLMIIISGFTFADSDEKEVVNDGRESFKVFVTIDGVATNDYRVVPFTITGTEVKVEKNDDESFFTVFHIKKGELKAFLYPEGDDAVAITKLEFDLTKKVGSEDGPPNESVIVSLEKPMYTLPIYKSNGSKIDDSVHKSHHAKLGKQGDDPWVYDMVNMTSTGLIHLQHLDKGKYWLEIENHSGLDINTPGRMLFSVDENSQVEGLDQYVRYPAPDSELTVAYKTGSDKHPYRTSISIYKKGTGAIGSTYIATVFTKEALAGSLTGYADGSYEFDSRVWRTKDDKTSSDYTGVLTVGDGEYNFNLPSYINYDFIIKESENTTELPVQNSNLNFSGSAIVDEEQKILEYNDVLEFETLGVKMLFPNRIGQADEFVTLRTLNRSAYGDLLTNLNYSFETSFVSKTYEVKITKHGDTNRYEISLPIEVDKVSNMKNVSCYGLDTTLNEWVNLGGTMNYTTKTLRFTAKDYEVFVLAEGAPEFSDMENYSWASPAVNRLASKGVIKGYGNNSFKPGKKISKAEFIAIVVNAIGLDGDGTLVFEDTKDKWYQEIMSIAVDFTLIDSIDNFVEPEKLINREEMAVILDKVLKLYPNIKAVRKEFVFEDQDEISTSALDSVKNVQLKGLISGKGNGFYPKDTANRAEASQVISNLMEVIRIFSVK